MAASGFTPIQLYYSVTATNVPLAANLAYGELAINATDGKMYYKSTAGGGTVVKIADAATATGSVLGGTAGALVYQSAPSTSAFVSIGTSTYILTSNGTIPVYTNPASITVGLATLATSATTAGSATTATTATNLAGGTANQLAYQSSAGTTTFAPAPSTVGYVLGWTGSAFSWVNAPAATSATNLAGGGANTVVYQSSAGTTAYLTNGTTGQALVANTGAAPTWGVPTAATNIANGTTGQVPYQSAPGATAFTGPGAAGGVFYSAGASTPSFTTAGTTGQALVSAGASAPTFGTLPIAGGGTNSTATPTAGGVVYGTGTAQAYSAVGTTGQALVSAGASAPAFGTLPIAGGGTGQTTAAAAFTALAPSQGGNSGKYLTTDGTNASWAAAGGISQVTTATTATTLTNTPTLLQITPASYGITVTLPDATTCSVGGPLHCIDNRGAYPVRIANTSGTLLGFIFAGVVSAISLDNNSTAAGVWAISSNELAGASAQLLTTGIQSVIQCLSVDADREYLQGHNASGHLVGVVYNKTTNTFGSVTAIRTVGGGSNYIDPAILSAANQILVCSCGNGAATFEAVVLTLTGTSIAVGTAATATLSASISSFADGCGLIAVGSSFVTSYTVTTPAAQIRALSISGTTVTIGSASALDGTAGGLIADGGSSKVIAVSTATTHLYTKPYTVSGSTLSAGTGTDTTIANNVTLGKFTALSTRWVALYVNQTNYEISGGVITLSGTTTTITTVLLTTTNVSPAVGDAIVVGSNKVLVLSTGSSSNANILTDTAGTASAGTASTLTSETARSCVYVSGTDVIVSDGSASQSILSVDCSGASPVLTSKQQLSSTQYASPFGASNAVLSRTASGVYGSAFAQQTTANTTPTTTSQSLVVRGGVASTRISQMPKINGTNYRGKTASENWMSDSSTVIQKRECVA